MASVLIPMESDYNNRDVIFIKVGSDTLENGMVAVADALDTTNTVGNNYSVYTPAKITSITSCKNPIIVNADEFYQDSMGNRIRITDPTMITFSNGQIIRAIRPRTNSRFFLSTEGYTGTTAVGQYLIPVANAYKMGAVADLTTNPDFAFKVEAINQKYTFTGLKSLSGIVVRLVRLKEE